MLHGKRTEALSLGLVLQNLDENRIQLGVTARSKQARRLIAHSIIIIGITQHGAQRGPIPLVCGVSATIEAGKQPLY